MEFIDLQKQYQVMKTEMDQGILGVLGTSNYILGEPVVRLEHELANFVGVNNCITCANGTDALLMLLMIKGISEGDAVFVSSFTFFSVPEAVLLRGATPVFVDVDKTTFNMDPQKLEDAIREVLSECKLNPACVIPSDVFGLPANYEKISAIAQKYGLKIIEDATQGFGGMIGQKKACSLGEISTTSFFPTMPLGCYGDGGAIFTNDDFLAQELRCLRKHGESGYKYNHIRIGLNSRLDTLQASVLLVKLKAFKGYELERRSELASLYTQKLSGIVKTQIVPEGYFSSWAKFTIKLEDSQQRAHIKSELAERNIPTMIYYERPLNKQQAFKGKEQYQKSFTVTEKLCSQVLSLPMHPYLTNEEVDSTCELIKSLL